MDLTWIGVAVAVFAILAVLNRGRAVEASALGDLRDRGAQRFVKYVLSKLVTEAAKGRSDYEFHFRPYDVFLCWNSIGFGLAYPVLAQFWDCIDSAGSRDVIQAMLEAPGSGLRVEWSIHIKYPQRWSPKWVLSCRWDRLELTRRKEFGGR
jgi:hypothetical protein